MKDPQKSNLWIVTAVLCTVFIAGVARGIPTLQLYSPGAEYEDETWRQGAEPFELLVSGARTPRNIDTIDNLHLFFSFPGKPEGWGRSVDQGPRLHISYKGSRGAAPIFGNPDTNPFALSRSYDGDDLRYGTPDDFVDFGGSSSPHGVYPAPTWVVPLFPEGDPGANALEVGIAGEKVFDFDGDFDPSRPAGPDGEKWGYGDIQYFEISYSPHGTAFHTDALGYAHNGFSQWRFAPYSHDVLATAEPGTLAIFVLGLGGIAVHILRRRNRSES